MTRSAGTRTTSTWRMLLSVMLLALAFRIAAPPGFMIDVEPRGLAVTVCTAHGSSVAYLDLAGDHDGSKPTPARDERSGAPCSFALAPTIAPPAQMAAIIALGGFSLAGDAHARDRGLDVAARAHARPPPRGPPVLA